MRATYPRSTQTEDAAGIVRAGLAGAVGLAGAMGQRVRERGRGTQSDDARLAAAEPGGRGSGPADGEGGGHEDRGSLSGEFDDEDEAGEGALRI